MAPSTTCVTFELGDGMRWPPMERVRAAALSPYLAALLQGGFAEERQERVSLRVDVPLYEGAQERWPGAVDLFGRLLLAFAQEDGGTPPPPAQQLRPCLDLLAHLAQALFVSSVEAHLQLLLRQEEEAPLCEATAIAANLWDRLPQHVMAQGLDDGAWPAALATLLPSTDALDLLEAWAGSARDEEGEHPAPPGRLLDAHASGLAQLLGVPLLASAAAICDRLSQELLGGVLDVRAFLCAHPSVSVAGGAALHAATCLPRGVGAGDVDLWVHRNEGSPSGVLCALLEALGPRALIVGEAGPVLTLAIAGSPRNLQVIHTGAEGLRDLLAGFDAGVVQVGLQASAASGASPQLLVSPSFLRTHATGAIPCWRRGPHSAVRASKYAQRGYTLPAGMTALPPEDPALVASDLKAFTFQEAPATPRLAAELLHRYRAALPAVVNAVFVPHAAAAGLALRAGGGSADPALASLLQNWAPCIMPVRGWHLYPGGGGGEEGQQFPSAPRHFDTGVVTVWFASRAAGAREEEGRVLVDKLSVRVPRSSPMAAAVERLSEEGRHAPAPHLIRLLRPLAITLPYDGVEELHVNVELASRVRVVDAATGLVSRGLRVRPAEMQGGGGLATGTRLRVVGHVNRKKFNGTVVSEFIVATTVCVWRGEE